MTHAAFAAKSAQDFIKDAIQGDDSEIMLGQLAQQKGGAAVKSFGAEAREEARFGAVTAAWRDAQTETWNRFNNVGVIQSTLLLALQAGLTGFLVHAWSQGRATPGDVAFAISAFMLMAGYLRNFGELTRQLQRQQIQAAGQQQMQQGSACRRR